MKKLLIFFVMSLAASVITSLVAFPASAELSSVTVAGSVKSFDEKSVVLVISHRNVRLPRELMRVQELKAGDAVLVTLRGQQIRYLLREDTASSDRLPASDKKR